MKKEAEVHQSAYNYGVQQMLRKYLKNLSEKFYENFLRPSKVHSPWVGLSKFNLKLLNTE